MSKKVYVPHLRTVGVEVCFFFKGMLLLLISRSVDPVCFTISPLYQITSSHQFHQLISPISNENYVSITYVTLKAPGPRFIKLKRYELVLIAHLHMRIVKIQRVVQSARILPIHVKEGDIRGKSTSFL